jgi:hypothetical protein
VVPGGKVEVKQPDKQGSAKPAASPSPEKPAQPGSVAR